MKIQNKRELQQIASNHSSDIDFKYFIRIYKKCTSEPHSFLVIDTNLKLLIQLWKKKYNIIMTIDDQIRDGWKTTIQVDALKDLKPKEQTQTTED